MAHDPLAKDIASFERMRSDLEKQHHGKFVVFHDGQFIGSFDSLENAAHEAVVKFGRGPYLIRKVGEAESMPMPASVAYRMAGAAR